MLFANPVFLFALFALAIPVLIHLFNFRRYKKIYFTNVRFLNEIKQETHRRSQLRQWILLLLRMLAIASLVMAFSLPFIPSSATQKQQTARTYVSIYLDNSFSMEAAGSEGRLIETAKTKAIEISRAYRPSDRFQLLTNDFEGRHQRFVSREEFRELADEIQVSPVTRPLSEVINRQQDILSTARENNREAWLISDFQSGISDLENARADSSIYFFFLSLEPFAVSNLFIDTVFFESPVQQQEQPARLHVVIRNSGADDLQKIPVKLLLQGLQKSLASVDVKAGQETEVILSFTNNPGAVQEGFVELLDYPIVYDDRMYIAYPLISTIPVLSIGKTENIYLSALFSGDSLFRYTFMPENNIDYSAFRSNSLIIIENCDEISSGMEQELIRYTKNGGHLLIIPPAGGEYPCNSLLQHLNAPEFTVNDTTPMRVTYLNTESQLFADVFESPEGGPAHLPENADLPSVLTHFHLRLPPTSPPEILMRLQNGDPFLISAGEKNERLYLLTAPLSTDATNFPYHPTFILTLYKMALLSQPTGKLYHYTGRNDPIEISYRQAVTDNVIKIKRRDGDFEIIPETDPSSGSLTLYPHSVIHDAGIYSVETEGNSIRTLAFNYDRLESELICESVPVLKQKLLSSGIRSFSFMKETRGSFTREVRLIRQGTPLWKLFIFLGLIFLAAEIIFIRLFPLNRKKNLKKV